MLAAVRAHRGTLSGFAVAARGRPGDDPAPFRAAGATWWLTHLPEIATADHAFAVVDQGPASS